MRLTHVRRGVFLALALVVGSAGRGHTARAEMPAAGGIWCRAEAEPGCGGGCQRRLRESLRRLTGLRDLRFAEGGALVPGAEGGGGSARAREILRDSLGSGAVFIVEDHSGSGGINFGQLDQGTNYEDLRSGRRAVIWRVRIDFDDFREMEAPRAVRESFDEGITLLHELLHAAGYKDPAQGEDLGGCEELVNEVRGELGLPLREQYFGEPLRLAHGVSSVRLRFRGPARREHYLFFLQPARR